MNLIYAIAGAFAGGIIAALLGWLDSKEEFDERKFCYSIIHSLVAAIGAGVLLYGTDINVKTILLAILGGAGVDVLGNRIEGAVVARLRNK